MNKTDIKQIILEEIEATLEEMRMSPEMMAADSRPEEDDITPPGIEDISPDPMFGADPSFVEEEELEEMARTSNVFKLSQEADLKQVLQFMQRVNDVLKTYKSPGQKRPKKRFTPKEIKALAKAMLKPEGFTSKDVIAATSYNSPAQANKFLKALEMKGLITLTSQLKKAMEPTRDPNAPETRGRKRKDAEFDMSDDPMADLDALGLGGSIDLSDPLAEDAASNLELKSLAKKIFTRLKEEGLGQVELVNYELGPIGVFGRTGKKAGLIKNYDKPYAVISYSAKDVDIQLAGPNEKVVKGFTQKLQSAFPEFKYNITGRSDFMDDPDFTKGGYTARILIRPGKTTSENKTTMSELEKYIKKVIKEAKNPLAKKMKEIENQGRRAALETKLTAIDEMIEETQGRLTRIDEDNEFRDMMDKNAVKEVRKQLKELERAKAKLQKEYGKMGNKLPKNYDEDGGKKVMDEDIPVEEDAIDEEAFELNESTLRMQKLAGLITESELKKKLSLNENEEDQSFTPEQEKTFNSLVYVHAEPMNLLHRRIAIANRTGVELTSWKDQIEWGLKGGKFPYFWKDINIKDLLSDPDLKSETGKNLNNFFMMHAKDIKAEAERSAGIFGNPQRGKLDATDTLLVQAFKTLASAAEDYMKAWDPKNSSLNESREKLMSMLSGVAKDMVEDGSLLPENPGGGPFNVTGNSEGFEPRQIAAHNQIKNAVKKLGGSVNYKVDGLSFTYMVKGDDLFVKTDD